MSSIVLRLLKRKSVLTKFQITLIVIIMIVALSATGYMLQLILRKPAAAKFQLSDFHLSTTHAVEGDLIYAFINVTNIGGTNGSYSILLLIDGIPDTHLKASPEAIVFLAPGETATATFVFTASKGIHSVKIGTFEETISLS